MRSIYYYSDSNQQLVPTKVFTEDGSIYQGENDEQN